MLAFGGKCGGFAGEALRRPKSAQTVRVFSTGEALVRSDGEGFILSAVNDRLSLEIDDDFMRRAME
jgi:hypothetical protein